jgi:DNA-binding MarR family transcriptional regulator
LDLVVRLFIVVAGRDSLMNTTALLEAVRKDSRKGLLLVAEQLGALLSADASVRELSKGLTGHVPQDERAKGIRDALLELLSAAEAIKLDAARRRPPAVLAKDSWRDVLAQLADGNVHKLTKIAQALGGEGKKGLVSTVLDELEDEGLVEPAVGPGMAKNARLVRLTEAGLSFVATLAPTKVVHAVQRTQVQRATPGSHGKSPGLVSWHDHTEAFTEMIALDSCSVAQSRSALLFDISDHPERSWQELDQGMVVMLAQVLGEATRDPMRCLRLSRALDLARPESEFTAEVVVPKPLRRVHKMSVSKDDE